MKKSLSLLFAAITFSATVSAENASVRKRAVEREMPQAIENGSARSIKSLVTDSDTELVEKAKASLKRHMQKSSMQISTLATKSLTPAQAAASSRSAADEDIPSYLGER